MKYIFSTILFFVSLSYAYGQSNLANIQQVNIDNEFIIKHVNEVIQNEIDTDKGEQLFRKGFGYINIFISDYIHGDTVLKVRIAPDLTAFKDSMPDIVYPAYYGLIKNRPVLLFIQSLKQLSVNKYSPKSKKRFQKWLEPYLQKNKNDNFTMKMVQRPLKIKTSG